jgi:competence protein ComEA
MFDFTRREQIFLAAIMVIIIGTSGIVFWTKEKPAAVVTPPPYPAEQKKEPAKPKEVVVYVSGAVKQPGVIKLPSESRVIDALNRMGGPLSSADLNGINLAALLVDGQQIHIPNQGDGISGNVMTVGSKIPAGKVNINTADAAVLDTLPGVGPAMAQKIIDYRKNNGPFRMLEDIKNVPGIGESKYLNLKDKITL